MPAWEHVQGNLTFSKQKQEYFDAEIDSDDDFDLDLKLVTCNL